MAMECDVITTVSCKYHSLLQYHASITFCYQTDMKKKSQATETTQTCTQE